MDNIIPWNRLKERKISVLIKNPLPDGSGRNESYVGILIGEKDGFLILDMLKHNDKLDTVIIRLEMILSVWVYKEDK